MYLYAKYCVLTVMLKFIAENENLQKANDYSAILSANLLCRR